MSAAYSIYELLRMLIRNTRWSEEQQTAALQSVDEWQAMNVFGMAGAACAHDEVSDDGRCDECGKRIRPNYYPKTDRDRIIGRSYG